MTPIATYRLQLRGGLDFDAVIPGLDYLASLGISHLYLSPICTAVSGSTHGYDVADPTEIDPVLGGEAGFRRLAAAAAERGIGIVLDLVPNHTALSVENPWLADTLRHGETSAYAAYFDIDWGEGLLLPLLAEPLDDMLAQGAFRLTEREGGAVEWHGIYLPLAPGSLPDAGCEDPEVIRRVLAAQPWRLRHWQRERDSLTHRRFFNITHLIGMRIERPEVFEAMMALPLRLVAEGLVQGLRIDHVDGLAAPGEYLQRLRDHAGPEVPIWVEKILTDDERMPDWPIEGTTGYEVATAISGLLTPAEGMARLDALWREETGYKGSFADACLVARRQVLDEELSGERLRLIDAADAAARAEPGLVPGPEALRETVTALLLHFPRYRSYAGPEGASAEDRRIIGIARDGAAEELRDPAPLDRLVGFLTDPGTPAAVRWQTLFQQSTGALVAKAQEDTAFYRYNRLLSSNEVGADPDHQGTMPLEDFMSWASELPPLGMLLGSSHDTKRGEDARARLIAAGRRPEVFGALWDSEGAGEPAANTRWYALQSVLAFWEDRDDLEERIAEHLTKALREAREITTWAYSDDAAEKPVIDYGQALVRRWRGALPGPAAELIRDGARVALAQAAVRLMLPGVPDIYQNSEAGNFRLTDPDNRPPWEPAALAQVSGEGFAARKQALIRQMLGLRRAAAELFAAGGLDHTAEGPDRFTLTRSAGAQRVVCRIDLGQDDPVAVETEGLPDV